MCFYIFEVKVCVSYPDLHKKETSTTHKKNTQNQSKSFLDPIITLLIQYLAWT